jgi:hypothetical protein
VSCDGRDSIVTHALAACRIEKEKEWGLLSAKTVLEKRLLILRRDELSNRTAVNHESN